MRGIDNRMQPSLPTDSYHYQKQKTETGGNKATRSWLNYVENVRPGKYLDKS